MLNRPYKLDTPENTIKKIQRILSKLDCSVNEKDIGNPFSEIFSARVETGIKDGKFGANGKGRTLMYAKASAYAELIERLQNGLLTGTGSLSRKLLRKIKEKTGFFYFPDEQEMDKHEFEKIPEKIKLDLTTSGELIDFYSFSNRYYKRLKENEFNHCICVPYYDVKNEREIQLPHNLIQMLSGSNGMAAGNTIDEAKFQALCEILERYAASEVYYKRLTPPSINRSILQQFNEYRIIEEIEKTGKYKVIVKDLSCSQMLPVLGIIIINTKNNKYKLNIGSDTKLSTALSRCLTEIYQGIAVDKQFDEQLIPIPLEEHKYFINNDQASINNRNERFVNFIRNGSGVFPMSLFQDEFSYNFDITAFPNHCNYKDEVDYLLKLLINLSDNVFIRNVSFLNFPSVHIYVPKLSRVGKKTTLHVRKSIDLDYVTEFDKVEDLFFPFCNLNSEKMRKIALLIDYSNDITDDFKMKDLLKLEFVEKSDWFHLPGSFFITLFWYSVGNYKRALHNLKSFMISTGNEDDNYYNIVLEMFKYKKQKLTNNELIDRLHKSNFDTNLVAEVINDFRKGNLFQSIKIPKCPDCDICQLSNECITKNKIDFLFRIHHFLNNSNSFL